MDTYWCKCGPRSHNFGDKITPLLLRRSGVSCSWTKAKRAQLFGVGSIISKIPQNFRGFVWTSGHIFESQRANLENAEVLALRGKLTLARTNCRQPANVSLGDGGLLCRFFYETGRQKFKLGIVPHYVDYEDTSSSQLTVTSSDVCVIDLCAPTEEVIRNVAQCEHIVSSSLHGLILADSLGIPNRWVKFLESKAVILGGEFKFRDYYSVFGLEEAVSPAIIDSKTSLEELIGLTYPYERPGIATVIQDVGASLETLKALIA